MITYESLSMVCGLLYFITYNIVVTGVVPLTVPCYPLVPVPL